jgi:hypothetical protein
MSVGDNIGAIHSDCVRYGNDVQEIHIVHQTLAKRRVGDAFHTEDGSFCKCGLKMKINKDDAMSIHTRFEDWDYKVRNKVRWNCSGAHRIRALERRFGD